MKRLYLTFDEFFKLGAKAFFEAYGYEVQTEYELFKLPKKVDVLLIEGDGQGPPDDFALLRWFKKYNLISYKSPPDRIRERDIRDALIYLNGYINFNKKANYANSSITILANHLPKSFLEKNKSQIEKLPGGVWKIDYGFFSIYLVNLNQTHLIGIDQSFLRDFAETEAFREGLNASLGQKIKRKKIVAILKQFNYLRIESFEDARFEEFNMPATLKADVTEIVGPFYQKGLLEGENKGKLEGRREGKREGKIEAARKMRDRGFSVQDILEITGLTEKDLREAGIRGK